jgi:catechol-2,3-dioxygenase
MRFRGPGELIQNPKNNPKKGIDMSIGTFSISLAVKDIKASKTFYEKLGFVADGWAMLRNTAS